MDVSRYCDTEELKFDLEFVTPAFIGGADGKNAELRASSFKGMIRFWWRILYGAHYGNNILEKENEIFGGTNDNAHKSNVILTLETKENPQVKMDAFSKNPMDVLNYLAYGKRKMGKTEDAFYIVPGEKFTMKISISKKLSTEQINQVVNSVIFFTRYGCVGSKARNGYGSMATVGAMEKTFKNDKYIVDSNKDIKSFSALSKESEMYNSKEEFDTWQDALRHVGSIYRESKSKSSANQEKRNPKEMFIHIRKNGTKYAGQILYIPRSQVNMAKTKSALNEKMKNSTQTTLRGGNK